jgi:predicted amidohydrolase
MSLRLALAQPQLVPGDLAGNLGRAVAAVETAATDGADLVALPELFTVGYFAFESYAREAEGLEGPTLSRVGDAAAAHEVGVVAGTVVEDLAESAATGLPVPREDGLANTAVMFDRSGDRRLVYRTPYLYGYAPDADSPASDAAEPPTAAFDGFEVGVATGRDVRRPERFGTLADEGATLVVVPSAWAYPQVEQWATLPRARAVENACYVAAVNGSGSFEGATLVGRSTVYDPEGAPLASCGDDPALVTADVDPGAVERARDRDPIWRTRGGRDSRGTRGI